MPDERKRVNIKAFLEGRSFRAGSPFIPITSSEVEQLESILKALSVTIPAAVSQRLIFSHCKTVYGAC